jgi:UDP-N-acetyl-D-glucosamine dehydrogenase
MPLVSLQKLESMLGGIKGKHIALFGISYRQDVSDTRFSPAESFYSTAIEKGAIMSVHDPLVEQWDEMGLKLDSKLPNAKILDAVVFAVAHREYRELDVAAWTNGSKPVVLDANDVLSLEQRAAFRADGCYVQSIGIGGE